MDRYVKGLLTAYDRVLNLISAIDPDTKSLELECLKIRINASLAAYQLFLTKEDIDKYESEKENKLRALEGNLTTADIDSVIKSLSKYPKSCKVLELPDNYFNHAE